MWKKCGTRIWDAGHKTVTLFQGASKIPLHTTLRMAGDGIQTHHVRVPRVKWVPVSARNIIQVYLNMVDWRHIQTGGLQGDTKDWSTSPNFIQWQEHQSTKAIPSPEARELIRRLMYEPPSPILLEGLEQVKGLLKEGTPVSWIQKTLEEELWEEEQFQQGHTPPPPGLQMVWDQLSPLLQGQQRPVEGRTIRDWRLSLTQAKRCDNCQCTLLATCLGCGLSRCGVRTCNAFCEPCGTCQTAPIKVDLKPPPRCTKGKRKIIAQPMSLNLHAVGLHFVESITGIEEIPAVDPALSEEEEQPLTDIRFRASVRGWTNEAHWSRAQTLLDKTDTRMVTMLQRDKECRLCIKRRGKDLDEETRAIHSKECKDCAEILQEPTRKGGKRAAGKGKQPTTKRTQSQVVKQREQHTSSQQVHYKFSDDEKTSLSPQRN